MRSFFKCDQFYSTHRHQASESSAASHRQPDSKCGKTHSLCWCSWASGAKEKQQTKVGCVGLQNWSFLKLVNHVMIQKDARIPIKNWKRILHTSVAVETSVPGHRRPTGFKARVTLNRIKVSIKVVMEDRASEKILTVFARNIKGNLVPADSDVEKSAYLGKE